MILYKDSQDILAVIVNFYWMFATCLALSQACYTHYFNLHNSLPKCLMPFLSILQIRPVNVTRIKQLSSATQPVYHVSDGFKTEVIWHLNLNTTLCLPRPQLSADGRQRTQWHGPLYEYLQVHLEWLTSDGFWKCACLVGIRSMNSLCSRNILRGEQFHYEITEMVFLGQALSSHIGVPEHFAFHENENYPLCRKGVGLAARMGLFWRVSRALWVILGNRIPSWALRFVS